MNKYPLNMYSRSYEAQGYNQYCSRSKKVRKYFEPFNYSLELIYKLDDVDMAVTEIYRRCRNFPVIGLDCEWTPVRVKNRKADVALLQIATLDGFCVLFRTCYMLVIPPSLSKLLADTNIIKVGVGISTDAGNLKEKFRNIVTRGCFDLRYLTRMCNIYSEKESLRALTKSLLDVDLKKDIIMECMWELDVLKEDWIQYAALDALVGVKIFHKILPLLHEQESEEAFDLVPQSELIKRYFIFSDSPCYQFLDRKL